MFKRNPFRHTKPKNGFKDVPTEKETFPLPDYLTDPNAVLGDKVNSWRYGKPPDYSNTRKVQADSVYSSSILLVGIGNEKRS